MTLDRRVHILDIAAHGRKHRRCAVADGGDAGEEERRRIDQRKEPGTDRGDDLAKPAPAHDLADLQTLLRHHRERRLAGGEPHGDVVHLVGQVGDLVGGKLCRLRRALAAPPCRIRLVAGSLGRRLVGIGRVCRRRRRPVIGGGCLVDRGPKSADLAARLGRPLFDTLRVERCQHLKVQRHAVPLSLP